MAHAPPQLQHQLIGLHTAARRSSANGVVAQTQKVRLRHWAHWVHFAWTLHQVDPFLHDLADTTRVDLLAGFAHYVREGHAGRGHRVRVGSVQDALCAVGQTFELDDRHNPTYLPTAHKVRWARLRNQLRAYEKEDPPTLPQLAVPVTLVEHLLQESWDSTDPPRHKSKLIAIADLCNIALYYLLRVGEHTKPRTTATNTIPLACKDVTFRDADGHLIPNSSPLQALCAARDATLKIPNQKNGVKGQSIHQQSTGTDMCPVKSLARRVHHVMSHSQGDQSLPLHSCYDPFYTNWRLITADNINQAVKRGAGAIKLYSKFGYARSDVSSHSLRAGGAMALHLNGVDTVTIQKLGRWKSKTFQMCIHEQISAFATGVSIKMSNHVPFRCIARPRLDPPANPRH